MPAHPASNPLKCFVSCSRLQFCICCWPMPGELMRHPLGSSWKRASMAATAGCVTAMCAYITLGPNALAGSSSMRAIAFTSDAMYRVSALAMGIPSRHCCPPDPGSTHTCDRLSVGLALYTRTSSTNTL